MEGHLTKINELRQRFRDVNGEEDLILITHAIGNLHDELMKRNRANRKAFLKRKKNEAERGKCPCKSGQTVKYKIDGIHVCQTCYAKEKKLKKGE